MKQRELTTVSKKRLVHFCEQIFCVMAIQKNHLSITEDESVSEEEQLSAEVLVDLVLQQVRRHIQREEDLAKL